MAARVGGSAGPFVVFKALRYTGRVWKSAQTVRALQF